MSWNVDNRVGLERGRFDGSNLKKKMNKFVMCYKSAQMIKIRKKIKQISNNIVTVINKIKSIQVGCKVLNCKPTATP